jgi:hypothetical protein
MSEERKGPQPGVDPCTSKLHQMLPDYDMNDSEEDLKHWPNLAPILQDCQATIFAAYRDANSSAMYHQTLHGVVAVVAAMCGMFAVLFAVVQLYFRALGEPLSQAGELIGVAEILAVGVAAVAVVLGLRAAFSKKWLLERQKAEGYRLLKFNFLISPALWKGRTPAARRHWLCRQVQSLNDLDEGALKHWAQGEEKVLEKAPPEAPVDIDKRTLTDLIDYYQEKARFTKITPHLLFFLSIGAAGAHFVYDLTHSYGEPFSLLLIMLAACFPVVGDAVRTLHTAHEFGRNAVRFQATSNELKHLERNLHGKIDLQAKLEVIHGVERTLEAERREWLRLMKEADWFG